jgi:hypothetical protein
VRPAEVEGQWLRWLDQRQQQPAHLRHRQREEVFSGIPLLPLPLSGAAWTLITSR